MSSFVKTLAIFGAISCAASCAHYSEALKERLSPLIGLHPDKLVEKWGAPTSVYAMENGVKVLTYTNDRQISRTSSGGGTNWRRGNYSYSYSENCKINFFTDEKQRKIVRYVTTGDDGACLESLKDMPAP